MRIAPYACLTNVTGFRRTLRMESFQKIEFDAWLISSTIESTRVQVLGQSCAWLWRYSALRSRHTPNNREIMV